MFKSRLAGGRNREGGGYGVLTIAQRSSGKDTNEASFRDEAHTCRDFAIYPFGPGLGVVVQRRAETGDWQEALSQVGCLTADLASCCRDREYCFRDPRNDGWLL